MTTLRVSFWQRLCHFLALIFYFWGSLDYLRNGTYLPYVEYKFAKDLMSHFALSHVETQWVNNIIGDREELEKEMDIHLNRY